MLAKFLRAIQKVANLVSNFRDVIVLMHGDGTNGAQNNTFIDSSANNFSITRTGNVTQGAFSPYGSNWSNYFDGNGDYLSLPTNTAFNFGTGDFTVECYANLNSIGGLLVTAADATGGLFFGFQSSTVFGYGRTGVAWDYTVTVSVSVNQWHHFALTRSGTSIRLFIDGAQVGTTQTSSTAYDLGATNLLIGGFVASLWVNGYISNVRVIKGAAQYTANFTPATAPLTAVAGTSLLTCQANRFLDASANAFTVTPAGNVNVQRYSPFAPTVEYSTTTNGGSGYFDGANDYLTTPNSANLTLGTSDFTISFWVYFADLSTNMILYDQRNSTVSVYPTIYMTPSVINYYVSGGTRIASSTIYAGTWIYIVVSRVSGTTRLFINGVQSGSSYTDSNTYLANTVMLGRDQANGGQELKGYLSDVRTVVGSGVTSVTVPTSPVTAITNTQLLLGFKNAGIYDNAAMVNYETIGSAQVDTAIKQFGTGSLKFNGTTDSLKTPNNALFDFGTGDFTIEFWLYSAVAWTSQPASAGLLSNKGSDADNAWELYRDGGTPTKINARFALQNNFFSGSTPATATWEYWALTRSGTTLRWFKNGVLDATGTNSGNIQSANPFYIGYTNRYGSYFNGNIDDLRITKGVCLYTTNFTPPSAAFPNT